MPDRPASPGRMVKMSAVESIGEGLIPKARRSCGVATYTGPDQLRPDAACWRVALVESSWTMSWEPSAPARPRACAAIDRSPLPVTAPPEPLPGPLGPYGPLGV